MERSSYKCLVWLLGHWDRQKFWSPLRFKSLKPLVRVSWLTAELLRHFFDQQLIRAICYSDHDMWDAYCWSDESPMTTTVLTDWDQILSVSCYWVQVRNNWQWYWGGRNLDSFWIILTPELLNLGSWAYELCHAWSVSCMLQVKPVRSMYFFLLFCHSERGNLICVS